MSTPKHTFGWTVEPEEYPLRYSDGEPCDTLHIRDERGTVAWVPAGFPEKARLISVLPELLEACHKAASALGMLKGQCDAREWREDWQDLPKVLKQLQAVIAKTKTQG